MRRRSCTLPKKNLLLFLHGFFPTFTLGKRSFSIPVSKFCTSVFLADWGDAYSPEQIFHNARLGRNGFKAKGAGEEHLVTPMLKYCLPYTVVPDALHLVLHGLGRDIMRGEIFLILISLSYRFVLSNGTAFYGLC